MTNNQNQNPQRGSQQSQTPRQDYKKDDKTGAAQKGDANKTGSGSSSSTNYDQSRRS